VGDSDNAAPPPADPGIQRAVSDEWGLFVSFALG
jgi:hypothetical protein